MPARIRIGVEGRSGASYAESLADVVLGRGVHWVEVDGTRLTGITGVRLDIANGFHTTRLVLDESFHGEHVATEIGMLGSVELVYLGADGEPLV